MDECISHTNVRGTIVWRVLQIYYCSALISLCGRSAALRGMLLFGLGDESCFSSFLVLRTHEVRVCSGLAFNHMATFRSVHLRLRRRYTPLHRYTVSEKSIILLKITKQGQTDALTEIHKLCHKPLYYTHITIFFFN